MQKDHLVDLAANDGFGECTCEQYHYVIHKKIQAGEKTRPCWHVTACHSFLKERLFESYMAWLLSNDHK